MKKVIFIGNRTNCLFELLELKKFLELIMVFVLKDSLLHQNIDNFVLPYKVFEKNKTEKENIIELIKSVEYDILISNGCPFILPIKDLKRSNPNAIFINTHPTYLPHLKGKTPLNGVFILNYKFIGATTHYIDDGIDTGDIIYQQKVRLTPDIDQGLIYMISFDLERVVFNKAMHLLVKKNYKTKGQKQVEIGSCFNRENYSFNIDFAHDDTETICKKINSLGLTTLYNRINLNNGKEYLAHNCDPIVNPYLINKYKLSKPGDLVYAYSDKLLVKSIDGLVKISYING